MVTEERRRRPGRPPGVLPTPAERRGQLLAAAEAAIAEHGPEVSMEEIATRAGVSKATLYDNFDGKAGLTGALVERCGRRVLDALEAGFRDDLTPEQVVRGGIGVLLAQIEANPEGWRFMLRHSEQDGMVQEIGTPIAALIASILTQQGADPAAADTLAHATLGGLLAATEQWSRDRRPDRRTFHRTLADYVWGGLQGAGIRPSTEGVDLSAVVAAIEAGRPATD